MAGSSSPPRRAGVLLVISWLAGMALAVCSGPHFAEHEVIVAQSARQMLSSGNWLIPHYLDTPFLVKPPLASWLVAAASAVLPVIDDPLKPVSEIAARLPSVLAVILTIVIVRRLARSMFDGRVATLCTVVIASSLGTLLFAVNATAEAILTLFCTWAFAEFWWSRTRPAQRKQHLAKFYLALGLAMLAKGPMPMIVVVAPLAAWWFAGRAMRSLARLGPRRLGSIGRSTLGGIVPRFWQGISTTGLWWGLPLFLAMFLPWMLMVVRKEPYAWELWDYEFLDRARGKYPGCHWGDFFYYIPILFGLALPWCLSLPEALAVPFLRTYRRFNRPLTYVWFWVVTGLVLFSIMSFKKPYYILPLIPGCALLLGPVLDQLFFRSKVSTRRAMLAVAAIVAILAAVAVVGWFVGHRMYPEEWHGIVAWATPLFATVAIGGMGMAGMMFVRARRWQSVGLVAMTGFATFVGVWCVVGPAAGNIDAPRRLVEELEKAGVPEQATVYWASNRPDGRVTFYWGRSIRQVIDPYKLMAERRDEMSGIELRMYVADRICRLLDAPGVVYMIFQREDFGLLKSYFKPNARELFAVDRGHPGKDEEDWVVVTNHGRSFGVVSRVMFESKLR